LKFAAWLVVAKGGFSVLSIRKTRPVYPELVSDVLADIPVDAVIKRIELQTFNKVASLYDSNDAK
jgi:hypothetical protein